MKQTRKCKTKIHLKRICEKRGVTQKWLAEQLGTSYNNLYIKLNGNPTLTTLEDIADVLKIPLIALLDIRRCPTYNILDKTKERKEE